MVLKSSSAFLLLLFGVMSHSTPSFSRNEKPPQAVSAATTLGELPAPFGWHDFCRKYPQECEVQKMGPAKIELTAQSWQILRDINDWANHGIEPVSDIDHWHMAESWDIPTDGKGDCEDYALIKRKVLIGLGLSPSALLMTIVYNRRHEGHAILTAVTDHGDLILDNQTDAILGWEQTGYQFVERQTAKNPNIWVRLSDMPSEIVVSSRKQESEQP